MTKLESSFKNMVVVLTIITLCSAGILAGVYSVTKEPIERTKTAKQQNAIREVLLGFYHLADAEIIPIEGVGDFTVYRAYDTNNNLVGAAVESFSNNGFSGQIRIMVGFDQYGTIINYSVLEQRETPGLGTKIANWFKTDRKNQNIIGRNAGTANLRVTREGGEIDAVTAATISSRAFLEAVRFAYAAFTNNPDAIDVSSGATSIDAGSSATTPNGTSGATSTDANSGATNK